jgi:hypothetical protein
LFILTDISIRFIFREGFFNYFRGGFSKHVEGFSRYMIVIFFCELVMYLGGNRRRNLSVKDFFMLNPSKLIRRILFVTDPKMDVIPLSPIIMQISYLFMVIVYLFHLCGLDLCLYGYDFNESYFLFLGIQLFGLFMLLLLYSLICEIGVRR